MSAGQRWEYAFGVSAAEDAEPALGILMALVGWPSLTMTFSVAQFAFFKKGLEKHGIELTGVTRRPHPEATT